MTKRKMLRVTGSHIIHASYEGTSMTPILSEIDLLEVVPVENGPVIPGDVLIFSPSGMSRLIVHRAMKVSSEGIRTRGDNCIYDDPWLLAHGDIKGRVTGAWRGNERRTIHGGRRGLIIVRQARLKQALKKGISRFLHPVYHSIGRSGIFLRLLPYGLRPRMVAFRSDGRACHSLLLGRRVIGRYDERVQEWRIRFPFRLFVDGARFKP